MKKQFLSFLIFSFTSSVSQAMQLLNVALSFYVLPPAEVGLFSLLLGFQQWLALVMSCGLRQVFALDYFHSSSQQQSRLINDILGAFFIISFLLCCIVFSMHTLINKFIFMNQANVFLLFLAFIYSPCIFLNDFISHYCSFTFRAQQFMIVRLLWGFFMTMVTVFLAWHTRSLAVLLAMSSINLIGPLLFGVYIYYKDKIHQTWGWRYQQWKLLWWRGLPFIPSLLAAWFLSAANRWLITHYQSLEATALFAFTDGIFLIFTATILFPIGNIYLPNVLRRFRKNIQETERNNSIIMAVSMPLLFFLALIGWIFFQPLWQWIVPVTYHAAFPLVIPRVAGCIFLMGTYFTTALLQYTKNVYFLVGSLVSTAVLDGILCTLMLPRYGVYGAVWALTIAYSYYFFLTLGLNRSVLKKLVERS